jgi:ribosomal protein L11 methyltransferase
MSAGGLLQVSVSALVEAEQAVADLLERMFRQTPVIYTDEETLVSAVSVYCRSTTAWSPARRTRLQVELGRLRRAGQVAGPLRVRVRTIKREDWAEAWKRHFKPLEIGPMLLVKPSWSRRRPRPGQATIVLDPGLSFGTGQHPTTAFCLEQVAACRPVNGMRSLLDLGTGSGILAIAAAKLGYVPVAGLDFDPVAVRVARANGRENGVSREIQWSRQNLTRMPLAAAERYDVVCANLLSHLLIAERRRIVQRLRRGGRLVLAGILATEFDQVRAAYETHGFRLVATRVEREWQSGAFERCRAR